MLETTEPSIDSLLNHACRISEKVERGATDNLIKGNTDVIIHLVSVRQLSSIIKQIKNQYDGISEKGNGETHFDGYPDW